ncbi:Crp/Fnr family transcriptional regulator [Ramlibacter tataouinensis]|uniref:Crp/Fnr family transcriptional regulator n=1 Tax=Ramlibacter tataouinensis TaxID=94132 RepID=UPI0022F3CD26|nr:Crp/Fnr family transcriptional regulator [Ramlibacter tataouinensis]WBY00352.1 Crp/Fnr family transcriptional regulator [Ramlibacter tataouinensis]
MSASDPRSRSDGAGLAPARERALLAALPLLKGMDRASLDRLAARTRRLALQRGQALFRIGDQPTGMYLVVFGEVRLLARDGHGRERLTGVASAGRSFGEAVMFLERPAVVDAVAAGDALLLHLPREAVFEEIDRSPVFARRIIAALSARIESLVQEQGRQARGGGRQRVIDFLARVAEAGGGPDGVVLPASKASIAARLHVSPEHFSRLLRELQASGLLTVAGRRIVVPDVAALRAADAA